MKIYTNLGTITNEIECDDSGTMYKFRIRGVTLDNEEVPNIFSPNNNDLQSILYMTKDEIRQLSTYRGTYNVKGGTYSTLPKNFVLVELTDKEYEEVILGTPLPTKPKKKVTKVWSKKK